MMADELRYMTFETGWGWMGLTGSSAGVRRLVLPQPSLEAVRQRLGETSGGLEKTLFADLIQRLQAYFQGEQVVFPEEVDYSGATVFQRRVWTAARLIPCGETESYGRLAITIGQPGAARAVGQALHRNPVPVIIPCHRVIGGDGRLGGFGGGLELKQRLLSLESGAAGDFSQDRYRKY